jgi:hypothetical protein
VENGVHRLFRQASARPNRQQLIPFECSELTMAGRRCGDSLPLGLASIEEAGSGTV